MNKLKSKEKENSLNEIRILASINHTNILSYKDAFYDKEISSLCVVTEYADDGDLEKKINLQIKKKTFLSETQIFSIFIQILNGLKSLHDNKIMHRDIKAANMLLFKSGLVKIGDMNVSKVLKNSLINTQTGTPYYASPEVWNNKSYDFKSDIWSLGCLLYEMTTLKAPFRGNSMKDLYEKVMKGVYDPIPNNFSKNLSEIIKSMLMHNPSFRPNCDTILRTIIKKLSYLCINFPFSYDNDSQNYYNLIKSNNMINDNNDNLNNNNEIIIDKENNEISKKGKLKLFIKIYLIFNFF
jgi:NIMA (never in mitosis gene a)-related kinase